MVSKYQATILMGTPTFFAAYLRKCSADEFSSLRLAIAGAEKLRESMAKAFIEKYDQDLLEGYGYTDLAPVVSINIPDFGQGAHRQTGLKAGTVGHPIPGVAVKVVDPDTGEPLAYGEEGLLLVKGPNRMVGYLDPSQALDPQAREFVPRRGDSRPRNGKGRPETGQDDGDRKDKWTKIAMNMGPLARAPVPSLHCGEES